jgi:hypothetical protein
MNDSQAFWRSIADEMGDEDVPPAFDPSGIGEETPGWVTKLGVEVMTMVMPRIQLRVGDSATPENVGAVMGNMLMMTETISGLSAMSARFRAHLQNSKKFLNGFDAALASQELPKLGARRRQVMTEAIEKILDRPADERFRFFRAFTRGIQPEQLNEKEASLSPSDVRMLNTLTVYGTALMNWQDLEELETSKQAYDFLVNLLSVDVVGHDPERIRRMFGRLGKKFSQPGRPRNRS